ncbi:MAG: hypothetical protein K0B16_10605, partial [Burkholderiaceae bacterium]|nr:hypothetical protein [Burkholderiaceae bacterium]
MKTKAPARGILGALFFDDQGVGQEGQLCQMKNRRGFNDFSMRGFHCLASGEVMEWMPPSPTASQCAKLWTLKPSKSKEASVKEVTIIGVDLAK